MKVDALAYPTLGTGADLLQMLLHAQRRRGLKSWEIALQQRCSSRLQYHRGSRR